MDKYEEFLTRKKIEILSNRQIADSCTRYVAEDLQNLISAFGKVYFHFKFSDNLLKDGQAPDEYAEADLAELRFMVQTMYFSSRGRINLCNSAEKKMIAIAMQYILSIFVNMPDLCMDIAKITDKKDE